MEQFDELVQEVIHLVRFGADGRSRDVKALARRMAQRYRTSIPELSNGLAKLVAQEGALRSARRPLPVDADSRMALARVIDPVLAVEPILAKQTEVQLHQIIKEHADPSSLKKAGLSPSKSALFVGPPGVGKTMAAQWIASRMGRPLIVMDLASAISSFLGKSGQNLRQLFEFTKEFDCVLLLDEVDAIAKRRGDETDLGELKRLVNVLLQELDEWPEGSLVLAATNHPDLLDPAIWRRFDVVIEFDLPGPVERLELLSRFEQLPEEMGPVIVELSFGMSQAEIVRKVMLGRRSAVLAGVIESDGILEAFSEYAKHLPPNLRHGVSEKLIAAGVSQRQASKITGTSRNTLRKRSKGESQ
ncbi:MAG: AAA family ATPase [Chthonomonadales bacterium]